ncbi:hypothetical protein [Emticicia agri]|nr:hypothetical protein [Emticicia agri]
MKKIQNIVFLWLFCAQAQATGDKPAGIGGFIFTEKCLIDGA